MKTVLDEPLPPIVFIIFLGIIFIISLLLLIFSYKKNSKLSNFKDDEYNSKLLFCISITSFIYVILLIYNFKIV